MQCLALIECVYGLVAGEIPEQQQIASRAIHTAASSRGEFPFSRNGSTAIMSARLISSSPGLWSDAVARVLDVFVIQACFVLCVPDFSPMQYMCYVSKYVFMLCYVQTVPDFGPMQLVPDFGPMQSVPDFGPMQLVPDSGPMQGTRSQSVPDFGPMQSVPDFGLMQLVPDFGPM